jgi:hypothetical protein
MSTASLSEGATAFCSFCDKPNTAVQRLVAGPGVTICNECVELSAMVIDEAGRATPEEATARRSAHRHPSTEDLLAALPALVRAADRVERELADAVARLREQGTEWDVIASAASMGVDAAMARFGLAGGSAG